VRRPPRPDAAGGVDDARRLRPPERRGWFVGCGARRRSGRATHARRLVDRQLRRRRGREARGVPELRRRGRQGDWIPAPLGRFRPVSAPRRAQGIADLAAGARAGLCRGLRRPGQGPGQRPDRRPQSRSPPRSHRRLRDRRLGPRRRAPAGRRL
ncbi:MAG: hypothetical protein AVDCRST_MAG45-563, partial [uncultured Solirubrobacterales bacterium]